MSRGACVEDLLRELVPQVLGALVRHFGHFDVAEDAVQEALVAAALQWPEEGVPEHPSGWLIRAALRRMTDLLRGERAWQCGENTVAAQALPGELPAPDADGRPPSGDDDTLTLLFLCCHPVLTPAAQIALTLRAVGGLTTEDIARAYLVPEVTMAERISTAKQRIKASGAVFRMPPEQERAERLGSVLHVLQLIFTEEYPAASRAAVQRGALTGEAIRITRKLHHLLPDEGEVAGLLALMLLTDARRPARSGPDGEVVPIEEQDRSRWNRDYVAEGAELVSEVLARAKPGPYQLQAAIAAVHDEAPSAENTDWVKIFALYGTLLRYSDDPMITLNHAVAAAMVLGPRAGLELLEKLDADERMAEHHRLNAVRAQLLEMAGDREAAHSHYRSAARRTTSLPEQRYLEARAARLRATGPA
jgi:predicted RNA polymerase sigma factor